MREGMLWFDNSDTRPIVDKVIRAADYYHSNYGTRPTLCFVHPTALLAGPVQVEGIEVRTTNSVLPNHFWLGVAE